MHFNDLQEAKEYAVKNPGSTFVKNPSGPGFVLKGAVSPERMVYKQKQEAAKREENIKHGRPVNSGLSWRDKELAKLLKLHNAGTDLVEISKALERSVLAVSAKLRNLELITQEEHDDNSAKYAPTQS